MADRDNNAFVENGILGLYGGINGVVFHDLIWPLVIVIVMKIIMGNHYQSFVNNYEGLAQLILMNITSFITLGISLLIIRPKRLLQAFKGFKRSDIKYIFLSFGIMLAFNFTYNFTMILAGIDVSGGNANQTEVISLINDYPFMSFLTMVVIAPLIEEITYRYFIYGGFAKINRKWAIVVSGFIFMCAHAVASFTSDVDNIFIELLMLPPYMFSGMVLAYAYDKKENLLLPLVIHALNNFISFILCVI